MIGAFVFENTWNHAELADLERTLRMLADAGVTTVFTEALRYPREFTDAARRTGLEVYGGIACFSDHADPRPDEHARLHPIYADGQPRPKMEWYTGLIPTDEEHLASLTERTAAAVDDADIDGFALDFIRWPVHWELEFRPDSPPPIASSYDPITLTRFKQYSGLDVPDGVIQAAQWINENAWEEWLAFRVEVINDAARRLVETIRRVRHDLKIGVYVVPGTDSERLEVAGQDVAALGAMVDMLLPMTYHAMVHRKPEWVREITSAIDARASAPVVPVVQVSSDPALAGGADWGPPILGDELSEVLELGLDAGGGSLTLFCGEALFDEERRGVVASVVSRMWMDR